MAIAFAVLAIGGSTTEIGIVFAAFFLPNVIFLLVGGVSGRPAARNLVMMTSDGVRAAVQTGLAVLLFTGSAEVWHIVIAAALHGTASAFFMPASIGLMPQVVSRRARLQQANALHGPVAERRVRHRSGGVRHPGRRQRVRAPSFAIDAATYLFSMITLALLRIDRAVATEVRESFLSELARRGGTRSARGTGSSPRWSCSGSRTCQWARSWSWARSSSIASWEELRSGAHHDPWRTRRLARRSGGAALEAPRAR